jgi:glycosyltransferase involved in cell wall biosynthesis
MKIAILHDYFSSCGGGERLIGFLAQKYNADIYTYFFDKERTYKYLASFVKNTSKIIIKVPFFKQTIAINYFKNLDIRNYDLFLFFGMYSIWAVHNHPNIWYSFGPPKTLFLTEYFHKEPLVRRVSVILWRKIFAKKHKMIVKKIDKIITISKYANERIKEFYNREAYVIYPPVEIKKFYNQEPEEYYLTVSRLEPNKRIELQIEAFKKMPDKKLIIVGDGSQRKFLESLAKGYKNIIFKGKVTDEELQELYARCTAFIFTPILEDFGLVAIEAMAAGKPVIAVNEGGIKETVIHRKTGVLIEPNVHELIKAVEYLNAEKAVELKDNCRLQARKFSIDEFYKKFDKILGRV